MKKLLTIIAIIISPLFLRAQETQLGESRDSIRKSFNRSSFVVRVAKTDTCDVITAIGGIKNIYFYRQDTCYLMDTIYPYNWTESMRRTFNGMALKKVKKDTWINTKDNKEIILMADKTKDWCIIEYRYLPKD